MALPFTGGSAAAGQVAGWGCLLSAETNSGWVHAAPGWSSLHALEEDKREKSQGLGAGGVQLQWGRAV